MTSPSSSPSNSPSSSPSNSPSTSPAPSTAVINAWQDALAAEHAAIFGYDTLGPRLRASDQGIARSYESAHRAERDATSAALVRTGLSPVSSKDNYPLPFAITSPLTAQRLALRLEDAAASAWRYLLVNAAQLSTAPPSTPPPSTPPPSTPPPSTAPPSTAPPSTASLTLLRVTALRALTDSAVRATHWRARITPATPTTAFPGIYA